MKSERRRARLLNWIDAVAFCACLVLMLALALVFVHLVN
jgi:hypothetical protein